MTKKRKEEKKMLNLLNGHDRAVFRLRRIYRKLRRLKNVNAAVKDSKTNPPCTEPDAQQAPDAEQGDI